MQHIHDLQCGELDEAVGQGPIEPHAIEVPAQPHNVSQHPATVRVHVES